MDRPRLRSRLARSLLACLAALPAVSGAEPRATPCPGDCDANDAVAVHELITGVAIALGDRPLADCPAFDRDGSGRVEIGELVAAVNMALAGCVPPTPTPLPTPTPFAPVEWTRAFDTTGLGWMMSGWGPGDGTLWVVGGTPTRGRIIRHQNGEWAVVDPGIDVPLLNWVHGTSATDVFFAGEDGTILHFDGSTWRLHETPVSAAVWGVWAVAPDDVWAVGGDVSSEDPPFVIHYDGESWTRVALPPIQRPRVRALFKVWGSGPRDIYAVGQNGLILHYDGEEFREIPVGVSQDLIGIWGTGADDITVVGGRSNAEIVHFDGERWTRKPPSRWPGLNGVWARRRDVAHLVGINGTVLRLDPRTLEVSQEIVPTHLTLHAVFGDRSGALMVLGANFFAPELGVALIRRLSDED